jgi:hypothetical protein
VYPYESNESFVLVFMHNNPMNQLNDEAVSAFGQICKQAESGPACWFSIDLGAIDPFSLARILGKSYACTFPAFSRGGCTQGRLLRRCHSKGFVSTAHSRNCRSKRNKCPAVADLIPPDQSLVSVGEGVVFDQPW